jgi:hypothetical protein
MQPLGADPHGDRHARSIGAAGDSVEFVKRRRGAPPYPRLSARRPGVRPGGRSRTAPGHRAGHRTPAAPYWPNTPAGVATPPHRFSPYDRHGMAGHHTWVGRSTSQGSFLTLAHWTARLITVFGGRSKRLEGNTHGDNPRAAFEQAGEGLGEAVRRLSGCSILIMLGCVGSPTNSLRCVPCPFCRMLSVWRRMGSSLGRLCPRLW